ncbi:MAG TPA: XdhC family protein [Acidimicrobiales bacterium]|nr:XdhC family protein [Acidimicrobiales bacterium]
MTDVLELAAGLARRGEPFVLASVLWRRGPTSGKQGAKAVIRPDGSVQGWLGGACAEPTVVRESLLALGDGQPRLLLIGPAAEEGREREGVSVVPMTCASEGALEVYLEPVLPGPSVIVIGRSPAVDALASLASAVGWHATIVDDGGSAASHPEGMTVLTALDLAALGVGEGTAIVVATQGHYDERALAASLETPAGYVGLVASKRRGAEVLRLLREGGVAADALARVEVPAGLDLGQIEHREIAVAILARLVGLRADGRLGGAAGAVTLPEDATDPVCGMLVDVASARYRAGYGGRTFYFCSAGCERRFAAGPEQFAGASS